MRSGRIPRSAIVRQSEPILLSVFDRSKLRSGQIGWPSLFPDWQLMIESNPHPSGSFCANICIVPQAAGVLAHATYDRKSYNNALFRAHNVSFPAQLAAAVEKRLADYLAGRIVGRHAMAALGFAPGDIAIGKNREPIWPKGISGSISHSDGQVACIATTQPAWLMGIDVEKIMVPTTAESVANQILNPDEKGMLVQISDSPSVSCTVVFSAKETLFKALYPYAKVFFGFEAASIVSVRQGVAVSLQINRDLPAGFARSRQFEVTYAVYRGYVMTYLSRPKVSRISV
jgi:enterobactin synthetase component D